jgi:hypothetical protein
LPTKVKHCPSPFFYREIPTGNWDSSYGKTFFLDKKIIKREGRKTPIHIPRRNEHPKGGFFFFRSQSEKQNSSNIWKALNSEWRRISRGKNALPHSPGARV